ncbi:scarecrow-like protein 21 [Cynara cardunculus var. scolymus]|uniref:Transcription factor GRAS n=1 Tax=Cynara cardunculus var. scolymus TaxID=59895 RepID=A0A103YJU1_CYNCS|nr:scarecrow-like protein 21 [Cynara cardunculus var. scolymus]KVI10373.1 Transcription factor GRAS [Cynara cardunculus var. scolymus]
MGSEQSFGYRVTGEGSSYSSSHPHIPLRLFESLKFEARDSPNSPFLTHFDSEIFTTLSDSQEKYSSTSGASPSLEDSSSFNQSGSSAFVQSLSGSVHYMKNALQDIETTLMAPDEEVSMPKNPPSGQNRWQQASSQGPRQWTPEPTSSNMVQPQAVYSPRYGPSGDGLHAEKRHKSMEEAGLQAVQFPPGNNSNNLKQLLIACASALSRNKIDEFEELVERARGYVSISGDPIQRLGAYMVEGLVARRELSGNNIYQALRCREPEGKDLLSYMHILYEICPYLKFGYMAANGAVAEACGKEERIHIIDFQIAQGTQWITLLQALAARPGGAPHVRITGIDDPVSKYARGDSLELVGKRLEAVSQKFNIPVEFQPLAVYAPYVTKEMLDVRDGEALAVNFPLQLHHMADESVDVNNPRDERLRMVKSLSPKVVTLVEQESNTNTAAFFPRFVEALDYYSAMFESMDGSLGRDRKERINVEQHCLARDIVNIIACEGKERVERHELLGKWKSRLTMAGFRQYPLSSYVNSVIRNLLKCYSDHYTLVEKDGGGMLLGWKHRNLISASAWH